MSVSISYRQNSIGSRKNAYIIQSNLIKPKLWLSNMSKRISSSKMRTKALRKSTLSLKQLLRSLRVTVKNS